MAKIKITESKLKDIISESVNKYINETFNGRTYNSGVFEHDKNLEYLENLVYMFTINTINVDGEIHEYQVDFEEFIDGIEELKKMSSAKMELDKMNIGVNISDKEYDQIIYDLDYETSYYADEYMNNRQMWDEYMPTPEKLSALINEFSSWIERFYENKIELLTKYARREYEIYSRKLNKAF